MARTKRTALMNVRPEGRKLRIGTELRKVTAGRQKLIEAIKAAAKTRLGDIDPAQHVGMSVEHVVRDIYNGVEGVVAIDERRAKLLIDDVLTEADLEDDSEPEPEPEAAGVAAAPAAAEVIVIDD